MKGAYRGDFICRGSQLVKGREILFGNSFYLMIDRPQKFSNIIPSFYGFIPQTYCGKTVGEKSRDILEGKYFCTKMNSGWCVCVRFLYGKAS